MPEPTVPSSAPSPSERLRELIQLDVRSTRNIAHAAGMSYNQLNGILSGHRANPSLPVAGRILAALGRRWADLDDPA